MKKQRYVIWAPPFNERSAGISALHRLCHWLNVVGHTAFVNVREVNPDWEERVWDGVRHDTIAIYPEVVEGNPFGCQHVVRWALCAPGHRYFGTPARFQDCDLAFYYAPKFYEPTRAAWGGKEPHRLMVSVFPSDMFFDWKGERVHDMYYHGSRGADTWMKYRDRVDLSHAVEFPGNFPNRYELAKALRRVRTFYMFDQVGALLAEAMLCGARAVLIREDGKLIECEPEGPECMQVFEPYARFDQPGDVLKLVELCAQLKAKPCRVCGSDPSATTTMVIGGVQTVLCSGPPVHAFDDGMVPKVTIAPTPALQPGPIEAHSNGHTNGKPVMTGNGALFRG